MIATVSDNTTQRGTKSIAQPSLWDEVPDEGSRQQELVDQLSAWAILNAYPELATIKAGRANWSTLDTWDLPRLETVFLAADRFTQRRRADFALSHWAIMHGHPRVVVGDQVIGAGLTSWVEWCKDASLESLHLALETASGEEA